MLRILLLSNHLKRDQLAEENQSKGKIRNASSTGEEVLGANKLHFNVTEIDFFLN